MPFDTSIGNGYTYAVYTSPLTGKKYVTHIYKKPSTEKLALCLSTSRGALTSMNLQPPNVSMSRIKVKLNCAFVVIPRPSGTNKKDFIGVFRTNGNLYADYGGARTVNDTVLSARFDSTYRSYPLFCTNGTTSDIRWCATKSEFTSMYSNYGTIISVGAPLVYHGSNVFTSGVKDSIQNMRIAPSNCSTSDANCHYNLGIGDPANSNSRRTILGMTQAGVAYLIATDNGFNAEVGAEMMKALGCYNAVFLDGGGSTEMQTLDAATGSFTARVTAMYDKASALVVYS